jgi:hypothetical protein
MPLRHLKRVRRQADVGWALKRLATSPEARQVVDVVPEYPPFLTDSTLRVLIASEIDARTMDPAFRKRLQALTLQLVTLQVSHSRSLSSSLPVCCFLACHIHTLVAPPSSPCRFQSGHLSKA